MKILALEKEIPGISENRFTRALLKAEAKRAWDLQQSGIIRELYFRQDRQEAVLILECIDTNVAHSILATLPLVKEGLIAFDLIPLTAYTGFSRLFEDQQ
jgi:hypothetical protein